VVCLIEELDKSPSEHPMHFATIVISL